MEKTLEERRAEIREEANAINQARREKREHDEACLIAGICPNCGSALRDITKWYEHLAFYTLIHFQCVTCNKKYIW